MSIALINLMQSYSFLAFKLSLIILFLFADTITA